MRIESEEILKMPKRLFAARVLLVTSAIALSAMACFWLPLDAESAEVKPLSAADRLAIQMRYVNFPAWEASVQHLIDSYPDRYPKGKEYLEKMAAFQERFDTIRKDPGATRELLALRKASLVYDNPAVDFDELIAVRRRIRKIQTKDGKWRDELGLPPNYASNSSIIPAGWENEITVVPIRGAKCRALYEPDGTEFIADLCLHFDVRQLGGVARRTWLRPVRARPVAEAKDTASSSGKGGSEPQRRDDLSHQYLYGTGVEGDSARHGEEAPGRNVSVQLSQSRRFSAWRRLWCTGA